MNERLKCQILTAVTGWQSDTDSDSTLGGQLGIATNITMNVY